VPIETVAGAVVAFVRLLTGNAELIRHIDQLEERYDRQFKAVFAAIRQLSHFLLGHSDESDSPFQTGRLCLRRETAGRADPAGRTVCLGSGDGLQRGLIAAGGVRVERLPAADVQHADPRSNLADCHEH